MEVRGLGKGFEDYRLGERWRTLGRPITEADFVAYLRATGMVGPSFNDHEYRRKHGANPRPFVPAALPFTIVEGICLREMQAAAREFLGATFEVEAPCYVGDTVHGMIEVIDLSPSGRGDGGIMRTRNVVKAADGRTILVYSPLRLMRGRAAMVALARGI